MKNIVKISFALLLMIFFSSQVSAQNDPSDTTKVSWDWYRVVKQNGVEYIAQIISDDGREVLIYTKELGKIYIPKSEIKSMKKVERPTDIVNGEFRDVGPFTTRYFFTTNALPIKKGDNYALINLYGPEVHFAVTNSTSIGVMASWIGSPLALAAKQTFKTKNPMWNLSVGTITGTSGYLNSFEGFGGLHFANVTYGNRNNNITFSSGFGHYKTGFTSEYFADDYIVYSTDSPPPYPSFVMKKEKAKTAVLFSLSGIAKVGTKASFVCDIIFAQGLTQGNGVEYGVITPIQYDPLTWQQTAPGISYFKTGNIFDPRRYFIFMPGMRFQKSDTKAFQFALAGVTAKLDNDTYTFPIPMCSWFYKF